MLYQFLYQFLGIIKPTMHNIPPVRFLMFLAFLVFVAFLPRQQCVSTFHKV
ncbi:hypothetical protein Cabther_B0721 [Chloracidobacterium thermophilum B]|uniref:Uncharacterized protein n=1 Tax=Chloracidobacterium thermophilum (strain B) TaxID=981222 RepID=G2LL42_CHLTF|nr:hypothetical protein Cabther_B0721 [Chloracidobacterium thermophilum B]